MRVINQHFRATLKSWKDLFREAADFATAVGPDNLISISHSADEAQGIVTVWYWGELDACLKCGYDLTGNTSGVCPVMWYERSYAVNADPNDLSQKNLLVRILQCRIARTRLSGTISTTRDPNGSRER